MTDNNNPQFLGGGPKFNQAGHQPPNEESSSLPAPRAKLSVQAVVALLALIILIGALYLVLNAPNGITRAPTQSSSNQDQQPPAPPGQ